MALLPALWSCVGSNGPESFRVQNGRVNLRDWPVNRDHSLVELRGDWLIVRGALVPATEQQRWTSASIANLPGTWSKSDQIERIVSMKATLEVQESDDWGLYISDAPSAIEIWVNGRRIGGSGQVGVDLESTAPSRNPVLMHLPKAAQYEIVIHMANFLHSRGGIYYPISFGSFEKIESTLRLRQIMDAGFVAAILVMGLYHAFLSIIRREKVTIVFALCNFAVAQRLASSNTRIFDVFLEPSWATSYRLEYGSIYFIAPLLEAFFAMLFPADYPRKLIPWRVGWYLGILTCLFFPISVVTRFLWIAHAGHIVTAGILIYTVARATLNQRVGTKWIAFGSVFLVAFTAIDIFHTFQDQTGYYTLHIGFLLFILFQAGAIAKNYAAIQERMIIEESKRKHSYRQLGKVFYPHQLIMMENGRNLEDTMPTGPGRGCVLCFDIISSSTIKHINKNQVIKNFFSHCYRVMMENYSTESMTANAYRLKEMGDGFLCSVGYPFKIPEGSNEAAFATQLALNFIAIFEEHVKAMDYPLPIFCAVGIAGGDLEGFYPESGTKEYDLYGRAVILATRYESMRKHIFQGIPDASMLIIQEEIFLSLPTELRTRFREFDLVQAKLKVRDDPSARVLYYTLIAKEQNILYPFTGS